MSKFKTVLLTIILPVLAMLSLVLSSNQVQAHSTTSMHLCKHQQYALCTSAVCVPLPGDPSKAICFCDVEEGPNMASISCEKLQPSTDANGIRTVFSTFSLEQFSQGKKAMKCPSGTPWTWCLNKRCTVDPMNPKKAICTCDVVRTGEWMTLGGNCDTSTCKNGYWSGATITDSEKSGDFMIKALGLVKSPIEWCEHKSP